MERNKAGRLLDWPDETKDSSFRGGKGTITCGGGCILNSSEECKAECNIWVRNEILEAFRKLGLIILMLK